MASREAEARLPDDELDALRAAVRAHTRPAQARTWLKTAGRAVALLVSRLLTTGSSFSKQPSP